MSDGPNPSAFPSDYGAVRQGMHLRDYFAAHAAPLILNDIVQNDPTDIENDAEIAAIGAYRLADAMLKQRMKS